ncbi:serine protease [Fodinibius saliphilus]|uniref:serine protease n=1 Tax=Fodinibius saliphilus TaxID=1920650 RepID=UPI001107F561|nr:serine protease [Fodinibius saliphilus]
MIEQTIPNKFVELADKQRESEEELFSKENVVGVALGNKIKNGKDTEETAIQVLVQHKLEPDLLSKNDLIPDKVKGTKTDVIEVGQIVAGPLAPDIEPVTQTGLDVGNGDMVDWDMQEELDDILTDPKERTRALKKRRAKSARGISPEQLHQRSRPVRGGFSIGHYKITAGTMSTACYDLKAFPGIPQKFYILSNNHVLANSNKANMGDPILQPGPYDGGSYPRDMVARLSRFIPIRFKNSSTTPRNYVDAAIAEVPFHIANREVYWIGHVKDLYAAPKVGDIVQKVGRTTDFSTGRVKSINATVDVNYGNGRVARFAHQILTTRMSAGGDSGSLVTTLDEKAVGLLFAGSPYVTVLNNILYVQSLLNIRIHEK